MHSKVILGRQFDRFCMVVNIPIEAPAEAASTQAFDRIVKSCEMLQELSKKMPIFEFSVVVGINARKGKLSASDLVTRVSSIDKRIAQMKQKTFSPPVVTSFEWEPYGKFGDKVNYTDIRNQLLYSKATKEAFATCIGYARSNICVSTCIKLMALDWDTVVTEEHLTILEKHWQESSAIVTPAIYDFRYPRQYHSAREGAQGIGVEIGHLFDKQVKLDLGKRFFTASVSYQTLTSTHTSLYKLCPTLQNNIIVLENQPITVNNERLINYHRQLWGMIDQTKSWNLKEKMRASALRDNIEEIEKSMISLPTYNYSVKGSDLLYPAEPVFTATFYEHTPKGGEWNIWGVIIKARQVNNIRLWGNRPGKSEGQNFCLTLSCIANLNSRSLVHYPQQATCATAIPQRCWEPKAIVKQSLTLDNMQAAFIYEQSQSSLSHSFLSQRLRYLEQQLNVNKTPTRVKEAVMTYCEEFLQELCKKPQQQALDMLERDFDIYEEDYLKTCVIPPSRRIVQGELSKFLSNELASRIVSYLVLPP